MALPDLDTSVGHSFGLEFDGIMIKAIQEVTGLKMEQDVIELKQNTPDGKYMIKKLPGRPKAGEVTLTRGLTADNSFEKWVKDSRSSARWATPARAARSSSSTTRATPIKRYKLTNAWPKSLEIGIAEGRRHQRAHREARRSPTRASRSSDATRRSAARRAAATGDGRADGRTTGPLRTEFAFELPRGYVDGVGDGAPRRGRCGWPRPATSWSRCATTGSGRTRRT